MPYASVKDLPASLKVLPIKAQQLFVSAFNSSLERNSEDIARKVAWAVVKKKFKKVGGEWVAKGLGLEFFTFTVDNSDEEIFIKKGSDGEFYLEAVLSTNTKDSQGKLFTEGALTNYANQINSHGLSGFITHQDWDMFKAMNKHLSEEEFVKKARTERKGILKTVKAVYSKGKLWIKAQIDKRYLNHVRKFNKVSIEALVPSRFQKDGMYDGGYALGFALDNNAINKAASITKIS